MDQPPSASATPPNPQDHHTRPDAPPQPDGQRDPGGRFAAGNRGGPGNPFARQTASLRKALVNAVSEKDIADIAAALLDKARQGDTAACKLLLSYTLGKPTPATDPDTLDQQELKILTGNHVGPDELFGIAKLLPVELVLSFFQAILPYLYKAKAGKWLEMWQQQGAKMDREKAEDEAEESAEAEADAADGPAPAESPPLEQAMQAWQAEDEAMRARLSAALGGTAPAKAPGHRDKRQQPPDRQQVDHREEVPVKGPGRLPRQAECFRPSTNGSPTATARGSPTDNKRH